MLKLNHREFAAEILVHYANSAYVASGLKQGSGAGQREREEISELSQPLTPYKTFQTRGPQAKPMLTQLISFQTVYLPVEPLKSFFRMSSSTPPDL